MNIKCTKIQTLQILFSLITHYQKTYCWPTRKKLLKLLENRYKTKISLSALDQHLASLNDKKYIKSFPRSGRRENGEMYNLPSNRQVTWKTINFLRSFGIRVPGWLIAWLKTGQLPNGRRKADPKRERSETTQGERRSGASRPETIGPILKATLGGIYPTPAES